MPLKLATAILRRPWRTCLDLCCSPLSRSEGGSGSAVKSRPAAVGTGTVHVMRFARRLCDASLLDSICGCRGGGVGQTKREEGERYEKRQGFSSRFLCRAGQILSVRNAKLASGPMKEKWREEEERKELHPFHRKPG